MAVIDGRTWLEHLSTPECWRLLAQSPVGRVGVLVDSAPEIYPVNHVVDEQTVVFRTDPGSKGPRRKGPLDPDPAARSHRPAHPPGTRTRSRNRRARA